MPDCIWQHSNASTCEANRLCPRRLPPTSPALATNPAARSRRRAIRMLTTAHPHQQPALAGHHPSDAKPREATEVRSIAGPLKRRRHWSMDATSTAWETGRRSSPIQRFRASFATGPQVTSRIDSEPTSPTPITRCTPMPRRISARRSEDVTPRERASSKREKPRSDDRSPQKRTRRRQPTRRGREGSERGQAQAVEGTRQGRARRCEGCGIGRLTHRAVDVRSAPTALSVDQVAELSNA